MYRTATILLATLLSTSAQARPPASMVQAKWAEKGDCYQTGNGIYDRDATGRITEWRVSGECKDGATLLWLETGFVPSGGSWTFKKWYSVGSRTSGPLPNWEQVEPALRHHDLRKLAGGMFEYAWGPVYNLQYHAPPNINYVNDNTVEFWITFDYTMNKSREKTQTMMRMHGRYEVRMLRDSADSDWYLFTSSRLGEEVMGEVTYSDEEFATLRKTMEIEEEWKTANPYTSPKQEGPPQDKSAAAKGAAAKGAAAKK